MGYVCAVDSTFGVRLPEEVKAAEEAGRPAYKGMGQPPKERPAPLYTAKQLIEKLPEAAWQTISWREGTKKKKGSSLSKRAVAIRVHRGTGSQRHSVEHSRVSTGEEGWLIAERPLVVPSGEKKGKGETKYYLSSLPEKTALQRLLELAHTRWAIEQFYEDAKGECGLGDFQGRRWEGLHRHLALVMLAYSFLMLHSTRSASSNEEEEIFPLKQAHDAAGDPQAGSMVAARGSGAVVHRN